MNIFVLIVGIILVLVSVALIVVRLSRYDSWEYDEDESPKNQQKPFRKSIPLCGLLGCLLVLVSQAFTIIPTGYTGVKITFGQISSEVIPHGLVWKAPFVERIETVNNKQQDIALISDDQNRIWGESSDKVQVYMADVIITYQISSERSAWIYSHVTEYASNLVSGGLVSSSLKAAANQLPATDVTNRGKIEPLAVEALQKAVDEKYGKDTVAIITIAINDMNFEDSYNEAISKKNIAQQEYEQAQIDNKKKVDIAQAEADAAKITAEGKAEAAIAEAEGQAKANKIIQDSITDVILKQEFYNKWDGQLPKVMGENQSIIDIGE